MKRTAATAAPSIATVVMASNPVPAIWSTLPAGRIPPPGVTLATDKPPTVPAPVVTVTAYELPWASVHGPPEGSNITAADVPALAPASNGIGTTNSGWPGN